MKVAHWSRYSGSGMNHVAQCLSLRENDVGIDSHYFNVDVDDGTWDVARDADIHVAHTHFPDDLAKGLTKPFKLVWFSHGTPEYVFGETLEHAMTGHYGHSDAMMLLYHWMRVADAKVVSWPRHQAIYDLMAHRGSETHFVPLGVDTHFWCPGTSRGKYAGNPSLWSSENAQRMKWPLDLITTWALAWPRLNGGSLHLNNLPLDQTRVYSPWINAIGAGYAMHWSNKTFGAEDLRNAFRSIDFFIGLVGYGDFNMLSLQAAASGARTISYDGNPHADFWLPPGDQRRMADVLVDICHGNIEPRAKEPVPDMVVTAEGMKRVYEGVLARGRSQIATGHGYYRTIAEAMARPDPAARDDAIAGPDDDLLNISTPRLTKDEADRIYRNIMTVRRPTRKRKPAAKKARPRR